MKTLRNLSVSAGTLMLAGTAFAAAEGGGEVAASGSGIAPFGAVAASVVALVFAMVFYRKMMSAPEGTEIMRFDDQATTVQAFLSGQTDLIVTGNAIAAEMIKDNPEMNIESKFVLQQSPCHVGVARGDEALLSWVNAAIYSHKLNGDLDSLSMKWFGEPLPEFPDF